MKQEAAAIGQRATSPIRAGIAHTPGGRKTVGDGEDGRGSRARTRDLRFWRPPLYQLSYTPASSRAAFLFLLFARRKCAFAVGARAGGVFERAPPLRRPAANPVQLAEAHTAAVRAAIARSAPAAATPARRQIGTLDGRRRHSRRLRQNRSRPRCRNDGGSQHSPPERTHAPSWTNGAAKAKRG